jgi:hypothetical protein
MLRCFLLVLLLASAVGGSSVLANPLEPCDPTKVLSEGTCAKCHAAESEVWKHTPHFRTFDTLHRSPQAKEIAAKLGISSIKRSELCTSCHYTMQDLGEGAKPVAGISCESCHGAARDWIALHNDYGPGAARHTESPEHRQERIRNSISAGMRNPSNLYLIARSCLGCHTAPHERLVNVGGHAAGSAEFNFVAWSQGSLKHSYLTGGGKVSPASQERLRVMYVVGLVAELEFSTRATAEATAKAKYGVTVAQRAVDAALKLRDLQEQVNHPLLGEILAAFAEAELRTNNAERLRGVAERIRQAGMQLAEQLDGSQLGAVDPLLPPRSSYK